MPIDWNAVKATQGNTPDTSIAKGYPASPLPSVDVAQSATGIAQVPQKPAQSELTPDPYRFTPDYTIIQGIQAGWHDTALGAMWHSYETPDFEFDSTFNSGATLDYTEKTLGRQFDDYLKKKLLATGSKAEFDYQLQRIFDNTENTEIAGQEFVSYLAGSILDVDLMVGGLVGKIPALAKAGKSALMLNRAGAVGATSMYGYGVDKYTALSPEMVAFQISAMAAGSLLVDALSKPKLIDEPPVANP